MFSEIAKVASLRSSCEISVWNDDYDFIWGNTMLVSILVYPYLSSH